MKNKPLKTIAKQSVTDIEKKGILLVKDWFQHRQLPKMYNNYYVVARWFEYAEDDWECGETILITKSKKIAERIFKDYNNFKDDFSDRKPRWTWRL